MSFYLGYVCVRFLSSNLFKVMEVLHYRLTSGKVLLCMKKIDCKNRKMTLSFGWNFFIDYTFGFDFDIMSLQIMSLIYTFSE